MESLLLLARAYRSFTQKVEYKDPPLPPVLEHKLQLPTTKYWFETCFAFFEPQYDVKDVPEAHKERWMLKWFENHHKVHDKIGARPDRLHHDHPSGYWSASHDMRRGGPTSATLQFLVQHHASLQDILHPTVYTSGDGLEALFNHVLSRLATHYRSEFTHIEHVSIGHDGYNWAAEGQVMAVHPRVVFRKSNGSVVRLQHIVDHLPDINDAIHLALDYTEFKGRVQINDRLLSHGSTPYTVQMYRGPCLDTVRPTSDELENISLGILKGLQALHQKGYAHNQILPSHVCRDSKGNVTLIGLHHATRFGRRLHKAERVHDDAAALCPSIATARRDMEMYVWLMVTVDPRLYVTSWWDFIVNGTWKKVLVNRPWLYTIAMALWAEDAGPIADYNYAAIAAPPPKSLPAALYPVRERPRIQYQVPIIRDPRRMERQRRTAPASANGYA